MHNSCNSTKLLNACLCISISSLICISIQQLLSKFMDPASKVTQVRERRERAGRGRVKIRERKRKGKGERKGRIWQGRIKEREGKKEKGKGRVEEERGVFGVWRVVPLYLQLVVSCAKSRLDSKLQFSNRHCKFSTDKNFRHRRLLVFKTSNLPQNFQTKIF